jgi:tetratricopeptide (TPR) repeat protein
VYYQEAQSLETQGKYIGAAKMYEKAIESEKASPSPRVASLVSVLNETGYAYNLAGLYFNALNNFEEALSIGREIGLEEDVAASLFGFGIVYSSLDQHDKAIKYYEEALAINKRYEGFCRRRYESRSCRCHLPHVSPHILYEACTEGDRHI